MAQLLDQWRPPSLMVGIPSTTGQLDSDWDSEGWSLQSEALMVLEQARQIQEQVQQQKQEQQQQQQSHHTYMTAAQQQQTLSRCPGACQHNVHELLSGRELPFQLLLAAVY